MIPRDFLAQLGRVGGGLLPAAVGLAVASALAEGAGVALLAPIVGSAGIAAGGSGPLAALAGLPLEALLGLWLGCVTMVIGVSTAREMVVQALREKACAAWRLSLHRAALGMEWRAFQAERGSDLVAALSHHVNRLGLGVAAAVDLFARLVLAAVQVALALWVAPLAAGVALAAAAILLALHLPRARAAMVRGQQAAKGVQEFHAAVAGHLEGMKLAKAHRAEDRFHQEFRAVVEDWRHHQQGFADALVRSRALMRLTMVVVVTLALWLAVRQVSLPVATLVVLVAVLARLLPLVNGALFQIQLAAGTAGPWREFRQLLDRLEAAREPDDPAAAAECPEGDLVLDGVTFTWPGRERPAVEAVSLTVAAARTTALVGPSGSGKSTLADLCIGLLAPQGGEIRLGGRPLTPVVRAAWGRRAAYVPQDGFLLHDTVRANLLWLAPTADEAALWQALETAAMAEVVRALPQGLDTVVGDRGVRLSGGERQRLAIARALLRRPRFLVLDEATSNLDPGNEALLRQALARLHGQLTVLVIAHRPETVRDADLVAVMENGRLCRQGGWEEIAAATEGRSINFYNS